ncbi:MAG: super-infection exclusion protein B [Eubacteriales bacterium]
MADKNQTHVIENVFDNLKKITPVLITIDICTGLIIFLPSHMLERMKLNLISDEWLLYISLIFLFSVSLTIVIICYNIVKAKLLEFQEINLRKKLRIRYINLSSSHKSLIRNLLNTKEKSIELNAYSGDVVYLENNIFIMSSSNMTGRYGQSEMYLQYVPQPWLLDLYNKEPELFQ